MRAPLALLFAALLLWAAAAGAQTASPGSETEVKAAFLYKFGDFVQWPPEAFSGATGPFVVGIVGADAIAGALERLVAQRSVQGHPVTVRRLRRGDSLAGVHVLFARAEPAELRALLASAGGQPILAVTDSEGGLGAGSAINFVVEDERVRFDIALPAAERARLKISSRLLSVARRVIVS